MPDFDDFDPFAGAPEDAEAQEVAAPPAKKAPAKKVAPKKESTISNNSEGKVVLTLKGGAGFDAPWIVVHADDLEDLHRQVTDEAALLASVMGQAQKAAKHFAGLSPSKPGNGGGAPARPGSEPPAGTPEPPGPGWTYKTGVNAKTGKTWKAWMPPRDSDEKPVWL